MRSTQKHTSVNQFFTQVDSAYEYCKWVNPQQQECDFEWKRAIGNITTQECHGNFAEKVGFVIIIVIISIKITVIIAIGNIITHECHGNFAEKVCVNKVVICVVENIKIIVMVMS